MRSAAMPASLQDVREGNEIRLHIVVRVIDAVPDACLGCEVNDAIETVLRETRVDLGCVRQVRPYEAVGSGPFPRRLLQNPEARFLETWIVVGVYCVEAHHLIAALQQSLGDVKANKTRGACNQDFHSKAAFDCAPGLLPENRHGPPLVPTYVQILLLRTIV